MDLGAPWSVPIVGRSTVRDTLADNRRAERLRRLTDAPKATR